jgi:chromosome segregation ATPase
VVDRNATVAARPRPQNDVRAEGDPLEESGQAILNLLREASNSANTTYDQAMETAQRLSEQVRAAEDRVQLLESELRQFADRAARAETWLARIHSQVEQEFFGPNAGGRPG